MHCALPAPVPAFTGPDIFVMPCSTAQKRFWMLDQISPGDTALVIPIALKLSGPLQVEVAERALNAIVQRHEILRTHFELIEGEPKQIIAPTADLKLLQMDLGEVPMEARRETIEKIMAEEAMRPLSLAMAPLLRATLVRVASEEAVLMLTAHHIISDGWSNGVVVREFGIFYHALLNGKEADLPPLSIQYADYVLWQEEWLQSPAYAEQMEYWKNELGGELPVLDFPADFARRGDESHEAVLESRLLPKELTDRLRAFGQASGTTLFMIFFSAYLILLQRYTGQTRLVVGTTGANRNRPELEPLIGLMSNLLLVPAEVPTDLSFRDFLAQQRDHLLQSFAHHEAPFERVVEQWQTDQKRAPRNLMQTHFLFQKAFMQPTAYDGLTIQPLYSVSPGSTFELTFGIVERAEGIRLQMEYWTSLFRRSTIQRFLAQFQALLESALANPEMPIARLPLFSKGERSEMDSAAATLSPLAANSLPVGQEEIFQNLDCQIEEHFRHSDSPFVPVKKIAADHSLAVLDEWLVLLPVGVPGAMYLTNSGASSPAPRKTPFIGRNCERGGVELLGRAEDLVRLPFFRINRRAAESRLVTHPDVREVATLVRTLEGGEQKLVGYVVLRADAKIAGEHLRTFLRERISDLLVPSVIMVVDVIPRNAAGKIRVDELPMPTAAAKRRSTTQTPLEGSLQVELLAIWRGILKTPEIGIDDNFFELGGNSFLALRMMMAAGKLAHRALPLSLLLTGATVANLARHIMQGGAGADAQMPLIPVQTGGTRRPIFFLHGDWAGGGFYCHGLAREIGAEQPFYALPPTRSADQKMLSIREMAEQHRAVISAQFPHGPYRLGGYCIGALVVVEMARQWIAAGETIEHVFLIDPPVWTDPRLGRVWPWFDRLGDLAGWDIERRIDIFDRAAVAPMRWWNQPTRERLAHIRRMVGLAPAAQPDQEASRPETEMPGPEDSGLLTSLDYSLYFLAYRLHRLTPLAVPATVLVPETTAPERQARMMRATCLDPAQARIEIVPGNHTTCVTQNTAFLAEKMREVLEVA